MRIGVGSMWMPGVGERRVAGRLIERRDADVPSASDRLASSGALHAHALRVFDHAIDAELLGELHRDDVARLRERVAQRDRPEKRWSSSLGAQRVPSPIG